MNLHKSLVVGLLSLGAVATSILPSMARPATIAIEANVRSGASLQASIRDGLPVGTNVEVLNIFYDGSRDDHWYYFRPDGDSQREGWVRSNLVRFQSSGKTYATLSGDRNDKINVRSGPGTDRSILHYGLSGDLVVVEDTYKEFTQPRWYRVSFPNGSAGWVREDLISVWPKGCIITCPYN